MQQNPWGDGEPQHTREHTAVHTTPIPVIHTASDCPIYGHDWQTIGMSGEKKCLACGIIGYCPGCTPNPPQIAQPFYCSRHTPTESITVQP